MGYFLFSVDLLRIGMPRKTVSLLTLFSLVKPYWRLFAIGMLGLAVGSGINLLLPELVRQAINKDAKFYLFEQPVYTFSVLFGLFALQGLSFHIRSYYFAVVGHAVVRDKRGKLYATLLDKPILFFDSQRTADLVSRLSVDVQSLQEAISLRLSVLIRYSFQVVVGVILMASMSIRLTLALLATLPVLILLSAVLGKRLKARSQELQRTIGLSATIADETLSGIRIVKAFGQEDYESERFWNSSVRIFETGRLRARTAAFFASFVSFLMNITIVFLLLYGIYLVHNTNLNVGDLTAFILYGMIVAVSFSFVTSGYSEITQALGALERIDTLLAEHAGQPAPALPKPQILKGQVVFENVSFTYPTRSELKALSNLSFELKPGSLTALVGPSGAGKSTLVGLLLGFYPPDSGRIICDGYDLTHIDLQEFRKQIAYVPQEPVLFAVSIADNIRYGRRSATDAEVVEAARQARVWEFAEKLPAGLNTLCGERGIQLSGGQRQRIAIARAILRKPALLLLDEATSSLDSENESILQAALATIMQNCTSLVIAHRLSTIQNADQLIVLEQGQIVQIGTHSVLSQTPGLYQELVQYQALR